MSTRFHEPAREVALADEVDVLVVGGGPAGVAAALSAARQGARARLIEMHGCLGGVWTSGLLSWVIDSENKPGVMKEIRDALAERGAMRTKGSRFAYDPEVMKQVLETLCLDAGVEVRLYTRVVAAYRDDTGRLDVVLTESKSGREAWRAKVFIDASGDGDLAAQAGCGFDVGHPETGETQPMSLLGLIGGVAPENIAEFIGGGVKEPKIRLLEEFRRAGVRPSYTAPTIFHIRDDLYALMANHEYLAKADSAVDLTAATLRARAELHTLVGALRALGGVWSGISLISTGAQIGVREGRRIHGLYTVTVEDMLEGRRHEDAVCRCTFGVDVHATAKNGPGDYGKENWMETQPYDIPLRALIARDTKGLLLAGRCISGDFLAHSSYRVTGNAVALGEASGILGALSARSGVSVEKVPFQLVLSLLKSKPLS